VALETLRWFFCHNIVEFSPCSPILSPTGPFQIQFLALPFHCHPLHNLSHSMSLSLCLTGPAPPLQFPVPLHTPLSLPASFPIPPQVCPKGPWTQGHVHISPHPKKEPKAVARGQKGKCNNSVSGVNPRLWPPQPKPIILQPAPWTKHKQSNGLAGCEEHFTTKWY